MKPYLLKTEPSTYSFADLEREGQTVWDGVRNPQALRTLAGMKEGDRLAIYHSGAEKAVVGTARVLAVDNGDAKNPRVTIGEAKGLKAAKTLAEMRTEPSFENSPLFRQFRLSVVPLTDAQYAWVTRS